MMILENAPPWNLVGRIIVKLKDVLKLVKFKFLNFILQFEFFIEEMK